jgi:hypothetical protein
MVNDATIWCANEIDLQNNLGDGIGLRALTVEAGPAKPGTAHPAGETGRVIRGLARRVIDALAAATYHSSSLIRKSKFGPTPTEIRYWPAL